MTTSIETRALVLRAVDYGESDRICAVLTPTHGKLCCFAPGARGAQRRFRGGLGAFVELAVTIRPARGEGLARLTGSEALGSSSLGSDLPRMCCGAYALELLDLGLLEGQGAQVYDTAIRFLGWLARSEEPMFRVEAGLFRFELLLLHALGVLPDLATCAETGAPLDDAVRWVDGVGWVHAGSRAHSHGPVLGASAVRWVRAAGSGRFPAADVPAVRAEIREALQWVWTRALHREPRSFALLRDTLRSLDTTPA